MVKSLVRSTLIWMVVSAFFAEPLLAQADKKEADTPQRPAVEQPAQKHQDRNKTTAPKILKIEPRDKIEADTAIPFPTDI